MACVQCTWSFSNLHRPQSLDRWHLILAAWLESSGHTHCTACLPDPLANTVPLATEMLVNAGADLNVTDENGDMPVDMCVDLGTCSVAHAWHPLLSRVLFLYVCLSACWLSSFFVTACPVCRCLSVFMSMYLCYLCVCLSILICAFLSSYLFVCLYME
jgi:hypothetical protein